MVGATTVGAGLRSISGLDLDHLTRGRLESQSHVQEAARAHDGWYPVVDLGELHLTQVAIREVVQGFLERLMQRGIIARVVHFGAQDAAQA